MVCSDSDGIRSKAIVSETVIISQEHFVEYLVEKFEYDKKCDDIARQQHTMLKTSSLCPLTPPNTDTQISVLMFHIRIE